MIAICTVNVIDLTNLNVDCIIYNRTHLKVKSAAQVKHRIASLYITLLLALKKWCR